MWIDDHRKIMLIASRVASEYRAAHIPTSINVPTSTMDQSRGKFPSDLNHVLVFYCNGWPECKKSPDASATAVGWGYRRVYWFRDGLPAWQARHYPVEEASDVVSPVGSATKRSQTRRWASLTALGVGLVISGLISAGFATLPP